ncbi:MAG: hypothetical protein RLZZ326_4331 [Planctomycetota bacterium]|jgi:hypothetical protein
MSYLYDGHDDDRKGNRLRGPPLGYRRAGMVGPNSFLVAGPGGDVS